MASIELTPALIGMAVVWFTSTIATTWAFSRRSRAWDDAENHEETLYGSRRENKPGIVQRVATIESGLSELSHRVKHLVTALGAHGSGEHQISDGVKHRIREHANAVYKEISDQRRALLGEQVARFGAGRTEETFVRDVLAVVVDEADPFATRQSDPGHHPPPHPLPPPPPRKR